MHGCHVQIEVQKLLGAHISISWQLKTKDFVLSTALCIKSEILSKLKNSEDLECFQMGVYRIVTVSL